MERLDEAREHHRAALAYRRELFGERSDAVAESYLNLALVEQLDDDLDLAIELLEKARDIQSEIWGPEHVNLVGVYNNLGVTWGLKKEYEKALEFHERNLELERRRHGDKHMSTARCYLNIAGVMANLRRYEDSLANAQRALASLDGVAEGHTLQAQALWFSGFAKVALGRRSEGMAEISGARASYERSEAKNSRFEAFLYDDVDDLLSEDGD